MYYNRTLSESFSGLIESEGQLRWLYELVKSRDDLDFLIGKSNSGEWISVYRGLSRIMAIRKMRKPNVIKIDGAQSYKKLTPLIYGNQELPFEFSRELMGLINKVTTLKKFDRYYKNKKEGFYQNELSRLFGICGTAKDDFVIVDKEAVVGYENTKEKDLLYGALREKYKKLQKLISKEDPKRYGKNLGKKSIGGELDFIALDKAGNIQLIEYKHGNNTSGIYLSPLQIGLYFDIFSSLDRKELIAAVYQMIEQKKRIGLIHPEWPIPEITGKIIPVLIMSDYNPRSSAKTKYDEILSYVRGKQQEPFLENIKTLTYTTKDGLKDW
jgi:hypothetical protein